MKGVLPFSVPGNRPKLSFQLLWEGLSVWYGRQPRWGSGEGGFWKKLTCVSWERVVMVSWRIALVG